MATAFLSDKSMVVIMITQQTDFTLDKEETHGCTCAYLVLYFQFLGKMHSLVPQLFSLALNLRLMLNLSSVT